MYKTSWLDCSCASVACDAIAAVFDIDDDELIIDDDRCGFFGPVKAIDDNNGNGDGVTDGRMDEVDSKFINRWPVVVETASGVIFIVVDVAVVVADAAVAAIVRCLAMVVADGDDDNISCIDNGSVSCFASISACVIASIMETGRKDEKTKIK